MTETAGVDRGVVVAADLDEIAPKRRSHPDDWLVRVPGGSYTLDDPYPLPAGKSRLIERPALIDGQVVAFARLIKYGKAVLTVHENLTWSANPPMPAGDTLVWLPGDCGTICDSVATLVEEDFCSPGQHVVEYYAWPTERWAFDAVAGRFERIAEA